MSAIVPTPDLVARPRAKGYDGVIDNILIRLAVTPDTPIQDLTADATPPRVDTAEASEDVKDEVGQRYSRSKLEGGAGLDYLHEKGRPDDAQVRFWDSEGLDVFRRVDGRRSEVRLLRAMDVEINSPSVYDLVVDKDGEVYVLTTAGVTRVSDQTQVITYANAVALASNGTNLYVAGPSGTYSYFVGSFTPVLVDATAANDMWVVKDKVLWRTNNDLYDADNPGTPVLSTAPGSHSINLIDVGPAIMSIATNGEIHFLALDAELALVNAGEQEFLPGERPIAAVHTFGVIGLATAQVTKAGGTVARFYTANLGLGGTYALQNVQLQYQIGDFSTTEDLSPQALMATRDSIYMAVKREGGVATNDLWRYFLPTGGYARYHAIASGSGQVYAMIQVNDRIFATIAGQYLVSEQDTYVSEGYFIGPAADFFTSDDKQWVSSELSGTVPLTGGFIDLYDSTEPALLEQPDSDSWVLVQTI